MSLVLVACLLASSAALAFRVDNQELAFSVEIPEGFQPYDYLRPHSDARTRKFVEENTLYAYNRGGNPEKNQYTGIFLYIERSGREMLAGFELFGLAENTELLEEYWGSTRINLHRVERAYTTGGDRMVTLTAAIPLEAGPIQIKLSGDVMDEPEMRRELGSILYSLEGEAGWAAHAPSMGYGLLFLAIAGAGYMFMRNLS